MARRKRIHGRKRRKSSLKFDMKVVNGAIGGADATKVSADKSSMTSAERQSEFVTKSEVKNQIDLSIKGQTPAQP